MALEAAKRFRWNLRVIDSAADDPAFEQPEAFLGALHRALGTEKKLEEGL